MLDMEEDHAKHLASMSQTTEEKFTKEDKL